MSVVTAGREVWSLEQNPPLDGSQLYTYEDFCAAPIGFELTSARKISYPGIEEGIDPYNPSGVADVRLAADSTDTTRVILSRTENGKGAYQAEARVCKFDEISGTMAEVPAFRRRRFSWEDPTLQTLANGLIIASGVHVVWNKHDPTKVDRLFTEIYGGRSMNELAYWGQTPDGHKDFRSDTGVVMIRPQGGEYDQGKMTYVPVEDEPEALEEALRSGSVTPRSRDTGEGKEVVLDELCRRAQFVGKLGIFAPGTWGGPTGIRRLGNGWNLVEAHAATAIPGLPPDYRIYEGFNMLHKPATNGVHIFRPYLAVERFPEAGAKTEALRQVFFSSAMHDVNIGPDYSVSGKGTGGLGDKEMCDYAFRSVRPLGDLVLREA